MRKGTIHSKEARKKMRNSALGKTISLSHRKRISASLAGRKQYEMTDEIRQKISQTLISRGIMPKVIFIAYGENHPGWKGGISKDLAHYVRERRNLKLSAKGSHTVGEWERLKALYNWTCPCCRRREPLIVLHQDHITPLSKKGSDYIENIQPLCKSCNSRKRANKIKYPIYE